MVITDGHVGLPDSLLHLVASSRIIITTNAPSMIGEAITDLLQENLTPEILIVAHSLGGLISSLTASYLIFNGINTDRISERRLVDKFFAQDFDYAVSRSTRVNYEVPSDAIPSVGWVWRTELCPRT
ncbi:hypothetical protein QR680_014648 [Steinernema hermaphroditum]|uniref:Fungal lipase-type domain-containing protein n=1 Tax=Steinernema hermaphroditum TaxID=289476 RepID=A0AA39I9P8_9BILA|nr:hypothetical protein QR680_014648 [Steinernema hermaphroditum]